MSHVKIGGKGKLYDLAAALPLIAWYSLSFWRDLPDLVLRYQELSASPLNPLLIFRGLARLSYMSFAAFLIALLILRSAPICKSSGVIPRLTGLLGAFVTVGFLFLPSANLSEQAAFTATLLIVLGMGLSIYTLSWLGRSFSIVPEARQLVTGGPYAWVRHPLYLFEEIAVVGTAIQFVLPWSLLLLVVHLALQITRLHYEERILVEAFPQYANYARRTARLIPLIY